MPAAPRVDYGLDAPLVIRNLVVGGLVALVVALAGLVGVGPLAMVVAALVVALALAGLVAARVWTSRVGKVRERERLLDLAELTGSEVVLDVGCGRGLLAVGAARRLTDGGEAHGVDVWNRRHLSRNVSAAPARNARMERVRIGVHTGDARDLPFDDEMFDVVVSRNALHHLRDPVHRRRAIREIDRVLVPGGRVVLLDVAATDEYAAALRGCGWREVTRSEPVRSVFPPARYVTGRKPAG